MLFAKLNDDMTRLILFKLQIMDIINISEVNKYHYHIIFNEVFVNEMMVKYFIELTNSNKNKFILLLCFEFEDSSISLKFLYAMKTSHDLIDIGLYQFNDHYNVTSDLIDELTYHQYPDKCNVRNRTYKMLDIDLGTYSSVYGSYIFDENYFKIAIRSRNIKFFQIIVNTYQQYRLRYGGMCYLRDIMISLAGSCLLRYDICWDMIEFVLMAHESDLFTVSVEYNLYFRIYPNFPF